jgi:hypothetical protein
MMGDTCIAVGGIGSTSAMVGVKRATTMAMQTVEQWRRRRPRPDVRVSAMKLVMDDLLVSRERARRPSVVVRCDPFIH